jgi:tRNA1Val (adenine37-N6)-methyltransferase
MKVTTDACLFGAWVAKDVADTGKKIIKALDIGAGTGLLTLMFAQKNEGVYIDSVEIEKDAAIQGRENLEASPWKNRTTLVHINVNDFAAANTYDVIFSNPPFYENELESPDIAKNIAHHSGGLSLDELLKAIALRLEPGGVFYVLLPYKRKDEIELLIKKSALFIHHKVLVSQSTRHDHFRIMLKGGDEEAAEIKTSGFSICDDQQQYTPTFTELLKDYYLKL